jgi:hypothetical protein
MPKSTLVRFATFALFAVTAVSLATASAQAFSQENLNINGAGNSRFADSDNPGNNLGRGAQPFGPNGPVDSVRPFPRQRLQRATSGSLFPTARERQLKSLAGLLTGSISVGSSAAALELLGALTPASVAGSRCATGGRAGRHRLEPI